MVDDRRHFRSPRWLRRGLGMFFGFACLAATCSGVLVLGLLLWSVVSAAIPEPPDPLKDPAIVGAGGAPAPRRSPTGPSTTALPRRRGWASCSTCWAAWSRGSMRPTPIRPAIVSGW